jgi:hypothetical protein
MGKNKKKTTKVVDILEKFRELLDKWIDDKKIASINDPEEKKKYLNSCLRQLDTGMDIITKLYGDIINYHEKIYEKRQ